MDVDINGQWTVLIIINCVLKQLCVIQVCIDENKNFAYFIIKLLWLFNIQFIISRFSFRALNFQTLLSFQR